MQTLRRASALTLRLSAATGGASLLLVGGAFLSAWVGFQTLVYLIQH